VLSTCYSHFKSMFGNPSIHIRLFDGSCTSLDGSSLDSRPPVPQHQTDACRMCDVEYLGRQVLYCAFFSAFPGRLGTTWGTVRHGVQSSMNSFSFPSRQVLTHTLHRIKWYATSQTVSSTWPQRFIKVSHNTKRIRTTCDKFESASKPKNRGRSSART
jgi:hypothetical protein